MSGSVVLEVEGACDGERLDAFLADHVPDLSRTLAATLTRDGKVLVNGHSAKPSLRVKQGDRVEARVERPPAMSAAPEDIPLSILYRDADMAVIDKPAGLVVHPAPGHEGGTIANALAGLFPETRRVGEAVRPGIVHRLDKDTSGLMLAALSPRGMTALQRQIASRVAERRYLALATGHLHQREGGIDSPIGRDPSNRKRMAVHGVAARPARTSYRVLESLPGFDLVEARLHTGRTHQIRVHLAAIGHPIAGDETYHGARLPGLHRQFLHAHALRVRRPSDGSEMDFESPLPPDLRVILERLRMSASVRSGGGT